MPSKPRKKQNDDPVCDEMVKVNVQIQIMERQLLARAQENAAIQQEIRQTELKLKQASQDFARERADRHDLTTDMQRQFKAMQSELLKDIAQREANIQQMKKLSEEELKKLHLSQAEKNVIIAVKDREIQELKTRLDQLSREFSAILRETLETISEKIENRTDEVQFSHQNTIMPMPPQSIPIPQRGMVGIFPVLVAIVISALEIAIAFISMIIAAVQQKSAIQKGWNGVLSEATIQFHLTWGLVLSGALCFVENSLRFLLNRPFCNLFSVLNGVVATGFILACLFTWLWMNDADGMVMISKYFLVQMGIASSPEQIRVIIYNDKIKTGIDIMISWLFPAQCIIVLVDSILSIFRKGKKERVYVKTQQDSDGSLMIKVDAELLNEKRKKELQKMQKKQKKMATK